MKQDQASATAYIVLQGLLFSARHPDFQHLVPPDTRQAAQTLLSTSREGRKRLRQLNAPLFRLSLRAMEALLLPGISSHYALRKAYIRDAVEQALQDGYHTVVNIGAGLDTLAYTLHGQHPDTQFIELDHPATSADKARALSGHIGGNLHLIAADLSQSSVRDVLAAHPAYAPDAPTLFICEGLLMYLDPADVTRLFSELRAVSENRCRVVFTCIAPLGSPETNFGPLLRPYLKLKGEPLTWYLRPKDLPAFISEQGYRLRDQAGTDTLQQRYLPTPPSQTLHRGEFLAIAESGA